MDGNNNSLFMLFASCPELMADATSREHMKKLMDARNAFISGRMSGDRNEQTGQERIYHTLYNDIIHNDDFWFAHVFSANSIFCEWTVGILGTYATIRRQRGDVTKCLEILELDAHVLNLYQRIADHPAERVCVRGLTYKYNLIVINANSQMENKEPAVRAFRGAVQYEIEEEYSFDQQEFGFMIQQGLDENYMTMECLNSTLDDYIWSVLMHAQDCRGTEEIPGALRVEPWICDGCGAVEDLCGDFEMCSSCKKAKYCSRACQVKHWKPFHKSECKKKSKSKAKKQRKTPKINVTSANLKHIANLQLGYFAETVLAHTGQQVTLKQKQAAFPGLVRFFKDFLLDRPEFNVSNSTFQDANRDAEFHARLNAYFEQQAGYESLIEIHKKPQAREYMARMVSPDKTKELLVDKETIQEYATRFTAMIAAQVQVFTNAQRETLVERITSTICQYILDHPEYNSYRGFDELRLSDECKDVVQEVLMEFMEGEGMIAEETEQYLHLD